MNPQVSVLSKMTKAEVQAELSSVTYDKAIYHYRKLHYNFIKQYSQVANITKKETVELIRNQMIKEINDNPIENQEKAVQELFEAVRKAIVDKLTNNKTLKQRADDFRKLNKSKKQKGQEEFNNFTQNVLSDHEIYRHVISSLVAGQSTNQILQNKGFSIADIVNQVKGYRNKVLLSYQRSRSSYKDFTRVTKGYYREALVHRATSVLLERLDDKIGVIHVGSRKNLLGRDTEYDEFIDWTNNVETSFYETVNDKVFESTGFGFQVKSWIDPWLKEKYNFLGMGSRSELFGLFSTLYAPYLNTYSWLEGVKFLEPYLDSAIGPQQVGFITGTKFYWTYQLIKDLREHDYYYAFVFDRNHQATKYTRWQTIDDAAYKD